MANQRTMRDLPLWKQRVMLVVFSPVMLLLLLAMAFHEAGREFYFEIRGAVKDMGKIWRGEL